MNSNLKTDINSLNSTINKNNADLMNITNTMKADITSLNTTITKTNVDLVTITNSLKAEINSINSTINSNVRTLCQKHITIVSTS